MRSRKLSLGLNAILATALITAVAASTPAAAQQETILHSFGSSTPDGIVPEADLIIDSSGNLYGTAVQGGTGSCPGGPVCGNVFELSPKAGGGWTEKILHQFTNNGKDGYQPRTALVMDSAGNLYGTTAAGGAHGFGTVFELTPKAGGLWIEKVLFSFYLQTGGLPYGGLILDAAGNLYGTTSDGGSYHNTCGTVFELKHSSAGVWTQKVLHVFNLDGVDGCSPEAHLIFDSAGNLYGTTSDGGAEYGGVVYQLTPGSGGSWSETLLHSFNDDDLNGSSLYGGLVEDAAGNLYGTTAGGGTGSCPNGTDCGTVFELSPSTGGSWNWTLLYSFAGNPDGGAPFAGLVFDSAGSLYGTTAGGGPYSNGALGGGTVFELTP